MPPNDSSPLPPLTIDEIVECALGQASSDLSARVTASAAQHERTAHLLHTITRAVVSLDADAQFEPPQHVVTRAIALADELKSRRTQSATPRAVLGAFFDRVGAQLFEWLDLGGPLVGGQLAFAGIRDDRGSDTITLESSEAEISIHAERTTAQDGVTRFVGEIMRADGTAARASVVVIDANNQILAVHETDSLGMFIVTLAAEAHEVAFIPLRDDRWAATTIMLALRPRTTQ